MNVWQIETLQLFSLRQCSSINKVQWTLPLTQNWLRSIALCIYYWQRSESWLNFVVIFYPRKFGILYQDCSDLLLRKNCSSNRGKLLKFEAEGQEFAKFLRSLCKTIHSNSERSEHFGYKNAFLTCSWRFLLSNKLEQFKLEKNIGI